MSDEMPVIRRSRTANTMRNVSVGLAAQFVQYALSFATRTVFVRLLAIEYLGVNGLFSNVLAMFSLAEMGVGTAFVSLLYKPLADGDTPRLQSLMTAFRRAYRLIGLATAVLGVAFYPFLDRVVHTDEIENLPLIYFMFLAGSVSTYFYTYKVTYLIADQKAYLKTLYGQAVVVIQYAIQIVVLLATGNFILYLAAQILAPIVGNVALTAKIDRMYPYLKQRGSPLDQETRAELKRRISAGVFHHAGNLMIVSTDSLVIATFISVATLGIYSNYLLIVGVVAAFVTTVFGAATASVGNLAVTSDPEKSHAVFERLQFINFALVGFAAVCLATLLGPFVELWLGSEYLLDQGVVLLVVTAFYTGRNGMQRTVSAFKNTTGLFYRDRFASPIEGVLNVAVSILLAQRIGLAGVFIGTVLSASATRIWVEPRVVFRHLFRRPVWDYYREYVVYGAATALTGLFVGYVTRFIPHGTWTGFALMAIACCLLTAAVFVVLFHRSPSFRFLWTLGLTAIRRLRERRRLRDLTRGEAGLEIDDSGSGGPILPAGGASPRDGDSAGE